VEEVRGDDLLHRIEPSGDVPGAAGHPGPPVELRR
jgi:hypothetical protein